MDPSWTLERAYASVVGTSEFYGVFLQQFADLLHRVATGSTTLLQPDDPATYTYQGIANLILAIVSVTAFALALALAVRSWLAAAFAWSLTLATPLWLGLSHIDFKDIPVAAGLTLISAGLIFSFSIRSPQLAAVGGCSRGRVGWSDHAFDPRRIAAAADVPRRRGRSPDPDDRPQ